MKYLKPLPFVLIPLIWILYMGGVPSCRTNHAVDGLEAFQKEDYQAAADSLTKAIGSGIKDQSVLGELYYYRATSWLILQDFNRCVEDGEQLIRMGLGSRGHVLRGGAMFMLTRYEESVRDFTKALEIGLNDEASALTRLNRARSYVGLEQWDLAFADAETLLKADVLKGGALEVRAQVMMARQDYEKCLADSSAALAFGCENKAKVEHLHASALLMTGRNADALSEFDRLIAQTDDLQLLEPLYHLRMIVLQRLGNYDEYMEESQKLIERGINPGEVYANRCGVWEILGEDEKGVADGDKAIELGVRSSFVYLNRAVCLQRLGRMEEASQDWDKAMVLEPRSDLPHFYRGLAYAHGKDYSRAVSCWRDGADLHDEFSGKFSGDIKGCERLRMACDNAKAALTNNSDVYLVSGWLYLQAKDRSNAKDDLEKSVNLNPKNSMAKRLLAGMHEKETGLIKKNGRRMLRRAPAS